MGVWTGTLPSYLRTVVEDNSNYEDNSTISSPSEDMKTSVQDIATYQVIHVVEIELTIFYCVSSLNNWIENVQIIFEFLVHLDISLEEKSMSLVPNWA